MAVPFFEGTAGLVLQSFGALVLFYIGYKLFTFASVYLLPPLSLSKYQKSGTQSRSWALITGASAGIGLGCAHELALRGFNVVLLGHKPDELDEAKAAIKSESPNAEVQNIVLDVIKASTAEIEAAIQSISHLPLTILINNVGGVPTRREAGLLRLADYTGDELDATVNMNARFMIQATRLLTPILARNGPSLLLTISSAAKIGMPYVAPYSACKAFNWGLSNALKREVGAQGLPIDVLAIVPGDVASQSNKYGLTPGTPTARQFAKHIMDRCRRAIAVGWTDVSPFWMHALQIESINYMPESLRQKVLKDTFEKKKLDYETIYKKMDL